MEKIIVLYNTMSANGKGKLIALQILAQLSNRGLPHTFYENDWPKEFPVESTIWLVGGDGTLNYFINKYALLANSIALFPGGTGNDFHWKLYGNMSATDQCHDLLSDRSRKSIISDVGICNDKYFINMIGLGFDGAVLQNVRAARWIGGHLGYLLIALKKIFTYRAVHYKYKINNEKEIMDRHLLFIVSNSSRTGGGFYVSPLSHIDDGQLNFLRCKDIGIIKRLLLLPKVERGTHLNSKFIHQELIQTIMVEAEEEIYYQLDGELMQAKSFDIKILKSALKFITL